MVLDTSAVVTLLFNEPDADAIAVEIDRDPVRLMSAASYLEAAIVIEARLGEPGGREFDLLVHKTAIEVVTVTPEQAEVARDAWRRFGLGRHSARLNYGDCFAYALAAVSGEPLVSTGADFAGTDIARVALGTA